MDIFANNAMAGTPVDASKLLLDVFFDIVSDLTFGKSFNALTEKHRNPIVGEFLEQQKAVGLLLQNMWLFSLIKCLPPVQVRIKHWLSWYSNALEERKKVR